MINNSFKKGASDLTKWQVYTGILFGLAAGWSGKFGANGTLEVADMVSKWYPYLGYALPILIIITVNLQAGGLMRSWFRKLNYSLLVSLACGLTGWIGATLMFLILSIQIPAIFGNENAGQLVVEVRNRVFYQPALLSVVLTFGGGLVAGIAAWLRTRNESLK